MKPTDVMREEHGGIKVMLRIVESIIGDIRSDSAPDIAVLEQIVEFFQVFADRCHHGKEEDLLFPALSADAEAGRVIEGLLVDHERGREYVAHISSSLEAWMEGDHTARERLLASSMLYLELLREHIRREDEELWPLADRLLGEEECTRLVEAFERVEVEKIGEGKHEEFHELMHELQDRYLLPGKTAVDDEREYLDERFNPKTLFEGRNGKFILAFFKPGQFIPIHSPSVDLVLYVVEGSGEVAAGSKRYRVSQGDLVTVPGHVKRGVRAETEMTVIHVVYPPPTEEDHREVKQGFARGTWE